MVYFICRSEYEQPHGRRIVEFPDVPDLLGWFQRYWISHEELTRSEPRIPKGSEFNPLDWQDQMWSLRENVFGGGIYGLSSFLIPMLQRPVPQSLGDVQNYVESFGGRYSEGTIEMLDTAIQAITDDDEIDIGWYLFDSDFARRHPERVSFLIYREFDLPVNYSAESWHPPVHVKPLGHGDEGTYCCFFSCQYGSTIREIEGCYRLPVRVPAFGSWLAEQSITARLNKYGGIDSDWPQDLILLRALALRSENPSLEESLRHFDALNQRLRAWLSRASSDYRSQTKNPQFLTGDKTICSKELEQLSASSPKSGEKVPQNYWIKTTGPSKFQFSPHLCQVVFTSVSTAYDDPTKKTCFASHWIFFDDLWAASNRDLAESILRYGRGDNVLGK
ncbi:hypothetical protein [Prosthecobacter sp.]|uniref:hypothetical protein n=1 Tax=Prosthecobacter sp. TaxID=1965333 RepID=UPI002ABA806E|nr:hypothetical protein [Prosthecobacter sp.]MDZ4404018.1 hypothetical protein [Prosthecobacter sp.]